jgi:MFS family permease
MSSQHTSDSRLFSRDFTLFFGARTISVLGDHMLLPITITVAMLTAGYGISGVGYALAAYTAPMTVFLIFGGVLVDRFTPLRIMVIADVARFGFHGGLAIAFATGSPSLWLILALLALAGISSGAFHPGFISVIPRVARDVQKANAALRVTESMMLIAGPASAGILLALTEVWIVLVIDASTFAVSAVLLCAMRVKIPRPTERRSMGRDLVDGWKEFRSHAWLWQTIVIFMLFTLTVGGPFVTLGQSTITLEHGESTLGLVMSALGVGSVVGGLIAARFRPSRPLRVGAIAMVARLFGPLAVALGLPAPWLAVGFALTGAGQAFWLVMFHTSVQTHVPTEKLGRVNSYEVAGSMTMIPVGQALAGPVALLVGTTAVLYFSSFMVLVAAALLLSVPAIRNLKRAQPRDLVRTA